MTLVGGIFLGAAVFCLLFRREAFAVVVAASAGVPATAAITVGGTSITPFQALGILCVACLAFAPRRITGGAGLPALCVFVVWSVLITAVGPLVFAGTSVLPSRKGVDIAVRSPEALAYTVSTVAQLSYLLLGVAVIVYFVVTRRSPLIAAAPFVTGTLLSSLKAASAAVGLPWPKWLFDNAGNVIYGNESSRMRGVFAEPSEFAGFSIAALAFAVACCASRSARVRVLGLALAALAGANLLLSGAGTAVIAGIVLAAVAAVVGVFRAAHDDSPRLFWLSLAGLALAVAWIFAGDRLWEWGTHLIGQKVGSQSMTSRTAADLFSLDLAERTFGLGVGLGGNRPSSFVLSLLSCVGVVGLVLFALAVGALLRRSFRVSVAVPASWGLVGLLIAKAVGLPDLSTPVLWVLLAACAAAVWATRERGPTPPAAPDRIPSTLDPRKKKTL